MAGEFLALAGGVGLFLIGMQIMTEPLTESKLLRIGRMYEAATQWHTLAPAL